VDLVLHREGPATVERVHTRRSVLARRRASGGRGLRRAQPIAANVDQVVVVTSAGDPEPNPRMLDRFLVIAEANGLPAAIVVNKAELDRDLVDRLERRFRQAGYQVLATSAKVPEGLPALRDLLRGRETVFTGASGVGKSSLLNALEPGLKLRIGAISEKWRTGMHTTRAAELVPLAVGGYVVDTPGMREVGAWGILPDELGACFPEFRPLLDQCRFDDCRHKSEPGCAVRAAAAAGIVDPDRLLSYERLYEEINVPSWSTDPRRES
jgi:ribosome biogenesis GTPase